MADLSNLVEGYMKKLQQSGLVEAPIYFNSFKTMTAGELLFDMLKFYPSAEQSNHKLTDAEELQVAQYFREVMALLEGHRPADQQPIVSKELTKELNLFFEKIDGIFIRLFGRDSSKFIFDNQYFNNDIVRRLFATSVIDLLRRART